MVALFVVRGEKPSLESWPLLLRATFGSCAVFLYVHAIGQIGAGPATMLNFIAPCYSAVFAPLFLKERSSRWVITGLGVATVGAALVALGAQDTMRPLTGLGVGAGVLSGMISGAAATSLRGLRRSTDPFSVYFSFCALGLLFSAPAAALAWVTLDARAWVLVLAMSVVSLVGQLLYTYALGFTETVTAGVTHQLTPVFSFTMAVVFLGDQPRPMTLGEAALCIAGVLMGLRVG
jgi:drug/metabolite transporter (DMT)-like permease